MRKNITLSVKTDDGSILTPIGKFAISGENYQGNLTFELDKPIEGAGTILIHKDATIYEVPASHDDTYTSYYIPILNSILTTSGMINVQLKITEQIENEHTPIFKSEIATGVITSAITGEIEDLEEYDDYFVIVDTLRNEMEGAESDISNLKEDMTAAQSDITSLTGRMSSVENRLSTLESKVATIENKVTTLENKVSTLESYDYLIVEGE